ncbi:MAG: replicative helicase, partial [Solirubrobacteraceae bacterium]|nr:replicative helicase [Solirubrobacteraceae bacterium]
MSRSAKPDFRGPATCGLSSLRAADCTPSDRPGNKSAERAGGPPTRTPNLPKLARPMSASYPDTRGHRDGNGAGGGGLLPPQSLEAEQSVLGAVLLSDQTMYTLVIDIALKPDDFYRPSHAAIFGAMLALYEQAEPVDKLTVTEKLKQANQLESAGGAAAIEALAAAPPVVGNAGQYGKIVKETALVRGLLTATYRIQQEVAERAADPRALLDHAERTILEVGHDDRRKDFRIISEVLDQEIEKLAKLAESGKTISGTPSGFNDLDEITGGFQPGNLIILAARPSMGKSALAANFLENAAVRFNKPSVMFSLEMGESELAQRFMASQGSIKGNDLRRGKVAWPKVTAALKTLSAAPLYVDDSSDLSVLDVRAKARRLSQQVDGGLGLVVIDYLQLMRSDSRSDNIVEQIGDISKGLKTLARELQVPVLALSQLSRGVEQRHDKRPMLSDLRSSG